MKKVTSLIRPSLRSVSITVAALIFAVAAAIVLVPSKPVSAALTGKNNEEKIFNFLRKEMGFSNAAACGVLANMERESHFNPKSLGDGGTSYGICQWHLGRRDAMEQWCDEHGYDYSSLQGQLRYMKHECETGGYSRAYNSVMDVPNTRSGAGEAAYYWCVYYEIPANTEATAESRAELAESTYWPRYKSADKAVLKKGRTYDAETGIYLYKGSNSVTFIAPLDNESPEYLEIPDTVELEGVTCKVTAIAAQALYGDTNLSQLYIGCNVTNIGKAAFRDCENLTDIEFSGKKVPTIGKNAFRGIYDEAVFHVRDSIRKSFYRAVSKSAPEDITVEGDL